MNSWMIRNHGMLEYLQSLILSILSRTKSKIPALCQRYCIVEISMLSNEVLIHVLSFKRIVQGNRCLTILQFMCTVQSAVDSCTLNQTTGQWICFYQY